MTCRPNALLIVVLLLASSGGYGQYLHYFPQKENREESSRSGFPDIVYQTSHSEEIRTIALSEDGRLLATGGEDNLILISDLRARKVLRALPGHTKWVNKVLFSPEGKYLYSASDDGTLVKWDIATGGVIFSVVPYPAPPYDQNRHPDGIKVLAISSDGTRLACGSRSEPIVVLDAAIGAVQGKIDLHEEGFVGDLFLVDGGGAIVTRAGRSISKRNVASGEMEWTRPFNDRSFNADSWGSLSVNRELNVVAIGSQRYSSFEVIILDISTGEQRQLLRQKVTGQAAIGERGRTLIAQDSLWTRAWDLVNGKLLWQVTVEGFVKDLTLSETHGFFVCVVGRSTEVRKIADGTLLFTLQSPWPLGQYVHYLPQRNEFHTISATGRRIWNVSRNSSRFINIPNVSTLDIFPKDILIFPDEIFTTSRVLSDDGMFVAIASLVREKTAYVALFDSLSRFVRQMSPVQSIIDKLVFSRNSQYLIGINRAFSADSGFSQIFIWNVQHGDLVKTLKTTGIVYAAGFSPDAHQLLVTNSYGDVAVYDTGTWRSRGRLRLDGEEAKQILRAEYTHDSHKIVLYSADLIAWYLTPHRKVTLIDSKRTKLVQRSSVDYGHVFALGNKTNFAVFDSIQSLVLWNIESGEKASVATGFPKQVDYLAFDLSDKRVFALSGNVVKCFSVPALNEEFAYQFIGDSDYVITTPEGFYMGTKQGIHLGVAYRLKDRVFPVEQFDLKFNRPDLVLKRMGYVDSTQIHLYQSAYKKRLKRMGIVEEDLSGMLHMPEVAIMTSDIPMRTEERTLNIQIRASDRKVSIDRMNVYVNNVPLWGVAGRRFRGRAAAAISEEVSIPLSHGRNRIEVSVHNSLGVESLREAFVTTYEGPTSRPDLYVIAIGVSDYSDTTYNLRYADRDAEAVAEAFRKMRGDSVHIITLLNKEAYRENILALKDTLSRTKVDDEVVLFFAGHGVLDEGLNYYLATPDMDFKRPARRGLPYELFEDLLDGIPARKRLLLVDACHSGEVDKDEDPSIAEHQVDKGIVRSLKMSRGVTLETTQPRIGLQNSFELMNQLFNDLRRSTGAAVISAAGGAEYAFESGQWGHGVFTYSLLEGLQQFRKVSQLRDYVAERVHALTGGKQRPTMRRENLEFDFEVY